MKVKYLLILFILSLCLNTTSCITAYPERHNHHKEIPRGHKKKKHKKKPARFDAPGHNKDKHKRK